MITCQVETWASMLPEASQIFPRHWEELSIRKSIPLDPNWEAYARVEKNGNLHVVTMRSDGILVGYCTMFIDAHMHYASAGKMAYSDMYYVLPEFRKGANGHRFIAFIEKSLFERGIREAYFSFKKHKNLEQFFDVNGWKVSDIVVRKTLEG